MQEQIEQSDETIGAKCIIQIRPMKRKNRKYEYRFAKLEDERFNEFNKNDYVYVLTPSEYSQLINQLNNVAENNAANNNDETDSLKQKIDELKQQLKQTNENTIAIDKHNAMINSKQEKIDKLTTSNKEYKAKNNKLEKELEDLKKDNKPTNQTNQLLNDSIHELTATVNSTKEQLTSDAQNKEKELKETIKKQRAHIDELTDKYQSLLPLKEYMPQKQHYKELKEIKDELTETKIELESTKSSIETKLATQKNKLEKEHDVEINKLKDKLRDAEKEHTDEKAHLLVAYNKDIDNQKIKYNELANKYNSLLSDTRSLTRTNTLINGKHKQIIKDKEPIEIELIPSEQLSSDEPILYVPKNEKQE